METILGLILVLFLIVGGICLFFLLAVQPIWGIVDVAISKKHSSGTKIAVILLTLLLLGPIMTFFYACFGTQSRVFRRVTVTAFVIVVISAVVVIGLAIAVPAVRKNLNLPVAVVYQATDAFPVRRFDRLRRGSAAALPSVLGRGSNASPRISSASFRILHAKTVKHFLHRISASNLFGKFCAGLQ